MSVLSEATPQMAASSDKHVDEFQERRHWQLRPSQRRYFASFKRAPRVHFWVARSLARNSNNSCYLNNLAMGNDGIFDLEKQFAFYGSFHNHPVNVAIHVCFVWPIFFTLLILLAYTDPLAPQWTSMAALPFNEYMVLNHSFVVAAVFALFYMSLEYKSGSLAAFLVLLCWMGSNAAAQHIPYATGWKIVAIAQTVCWGTQFIGHGVFEGRAPALFDNFVFANLVAPYFVLLEVLHRIFHYEPYAGFSKNVQKRVDASIAEFRAKKAKVKRV